MTNKNERIITNFESSKKMNPDYKKIATDLLNTGMWDQGRLRFIIECIEKNKPIYKTDKEYLEAMNKQLEDKIQKLQGSAIKTTEPKKNNPNVLISDKDLDDILDKQRSKTVKTSTPIRKKKSFLTKLFSR